MTSRRRTHLSLLVVSALLLMASASAAAAPAPASPTAATKDLVVLVGEEPDSLYRYGSPKPVTINVLQTLMDGPIDHRGYSYQPIMLTKIPSLADGDAVTRSVTVSAGDTVVADGGDVVSLAVGTVVRPAGCSDSSCAVTFAGAPLDMEQLVVTFTLKSGLQWSDGTPLTADDSVYGFEIASDPDTPGPHTSTERTQSYTAADATTVVWAGLPGYRDNSYMLRFWTPFPRHQLQTALGYTAADLLSAPESSRVPLGWGPFRMVEWIAGDHITVERNPYYWRAGEGLPLLDTITFRFASSPSEALVQLITGEADVATLDTSVSGLDDVLVALDADGVINRVTSTGTVWEHLDFGINPADTYVRPDFFEDVRTRRAVAYCLDRQAAVDTLHYDSAAVIDGYIPPEHPIANGLSLAHYGHQPAVGRALLEDVGWRDEDSDGVREAHGVAGIADGTPLTFSWRSTDAAVRVQYMQMFRQDLAACGIDVITVALPSTELFVDGPEGPLFGRHFDIASFAWFTGVAPPCELYLGTDSNIPSEANDWAGQNLSGYVNPTYDAACLQGTRSLPGTPEYAQGHQQALQIFNSELPAVPLFLRMKIAAARPEVSGYAMDPTEDGEFWNVENWDLQVEPVVQVVEPTTGTTVTAGTTVLTFPPQTFSETVVLTYTPEGPPFPSGRLLPTRFSYALEAVSQATGGAVTPDGAYTVSVSYTDTEIAVLGLAESSLALYYWDGTAWVKEPTSQVDTALNLVTATPKHFSHWTVRGLPTSKVFLPLAVSN